MTMASLLPLIVLLLHGISGITAQGNGQPGTSNASCTSTQYFVASNSWCANCVQSTGMCQSSSCSVFGGTGNTLYTCQKSCGTSYCAYFGGGTCTSQCFGMVKCSDNSTGCAGYGDMCIQDGSSTTFKICQSSNSTVITNPSPTPSSGNNNGLYGLLGLLGLLALVAVIAALVAVGIIPAAAFGIGAGSAAATTTLATGAEGMPFHHFHHDFYHHHHDYEFEHHHHHGHYHHHSVYGPSVAGSYLAPPPTPFGYPGYMGGF